MADRTSAGIFGEVFKLLATDPTKQHKRWAKKIWEIKNNGDFDFSNYQMYCDKELEILGLYNEKKDKYYGEEEE